MERNIAVKTKDEANGLINVPGNLAGMKVGDRLVITDFPAGRKYPEYAKYMKGIYIRVGDVVRFNLYMGVDFLTVITGECIQESATAKQRMLDNGYTGNFDEINIKIFSDMVSLEGKKEDKKEKKELVVRSIAIKDSDKKKEIIDEMISKVDLERLKKMISISMERGQKPNEEVFDWFIHQWAMNKYEFYLAFGRSLTISTPVSFQIDETEMNSMVYDLYKRFPAYAASMDLITRNGGMSAYVDNKLPGGIPLFERYCSEYYQRGMKVSKFFSHLFKDGIFDVEFSKLMQDRVVKGNVTISIDPYDFLTCSENMHNWHSCFSLRGQYRAGPYSYCIDPSSMVVFRDNGKIYDYAVVTDEEGTKDYGKNAFKGNSKSWRQFVHFDKETCCAVFSREYPSKKKIEGVREVARGLLESTISKYLGIPDEWDNYGDLLDISRKPYFGTHIIYKDVGRHHYSDISNWPQLRSSYDIQKAVVAPKDTDMTKVNIKAGAELRCFKCGKKHQKSGSIVCC